MTLHVVVMGVSGSGKSTVAEGIAQRLGWTFAEADQFHPQSNIDKMTAGIPLDDEDRAPWLRGLATWMARQAAKGEDTVIACSALKRSYRTMLQRDVAALDGPHRVVFVHAHGPFGVIADRMEGRRGHFMPESLLQSQFDTLEPLGADEGGFELDVRHPPDELVTEAVRRICS
ncbi:gluconokinase [Janibacter alittae]|uniref:Gluconokinase n=1 Tax=Janibacter alittae TaxID=3115209 RepID=A0ABZ2MHT3_9MICO